MRSATTKSEGVGELADERNPVLDSIARYLSIDLSAEGRAARNRRGIALVVHGAPLSGKTRAAVALAKRYECALLTIDSVIVDAMATSASASAQRARKLCADAAQRYADEQRAADTATVAAVERNPLSTEALAQHTMTR